MTIPSATAPSGPSVRSLIVALVLLVGIGGARAEDNPKPPKIYQLQAPVFCSPHIAEYREWLADAWNERVTWIKDRGRRVVEYWETPDGSSWTLTVMIGAPDVMICSILFGQVAVEPKIEATP